MSKSAYEIRTDLLYLAQKICSERYLANSDKESNQPPSTEEIIKEANKLNEFISKSSKK